MLGISVRFQFPCRLLERCSRELLLFVGLWIQTVNFGSLGHFIDMGHTYATLAGVIGFVSFDAPWRLSSQSNLHWFREPKLVNTYPVPAGNREPLTSTRFLDVRITSLSDRSTISSVG